MSDAFLELSTERSLGFDVGPIPQSRIETYAERRGLGELFVRQIVEIDRRYLMNRGDDNDKKEAAG